MFKLNDIVKVVMDDYLPGNNVKPPIHKEEIHTVRSEPYQCTCGELHLDIGLSSVYNFVTCYKCQEDLPNSDKIHWCHSSRFEKVS